MKVSSRRRQLALVLLPFILAACAHRSADLAGTGPLRPVEAALPAPGNNSPAIERAAGSKAALDPQPETGRNIVPDGKPDPGGQAVLSLSDLETIALEANPSLAQLAFVIEKARGIHEQVGLPPNPVIGYFSEEMGDDGTAGKQGGFIGQTVVTGNKLQLNRDVAAWNVQELSWEYEAQRYRVLNDVRLRFYEVLGGRQRLEIAGELVNVAREGVRIAEQLFQAQQASRADVLQAQIELNRIRIIRQNAQYAYEAAWKRLATVLGRPELPPRELSGSLTEAPARRDWQSSYQKLLDESPQLEAARSRIQTALAAIRRQEAQPIPNLLTQVNVAHDNASGDDIANVQIGIPLPVFNRNQGTLRLAYGEYQRALRDAERLELELRDELAVAFRSYQQAEYEVERYKTDILNDARGNLRLTEESYQAGQLSFLRVLTARRTYFEANLRYVEALVALNQAGVIIDGFVLTGGLTDVPDVASRTLNGLGQRGQALSGQ